MRGRVFNLFNNTRGGSCENICNVGQRGAFFYDTLSWTSPPLSKYKSVHNKIHIQL
jgi:hypothetical protein